MNKATSLYTQMPAVKWEEAYPIGNGRLGGMVFGQIDVEQIQLNEDSIWSGGPQNRINPDARENLSKVRNLISNGKISQAEELLRTAFSGTPQSQRAYQKAGDMEIRHLDVMENQREYTDYQRILDMEQGVVSVSFMQNGIRYEREYLASYPDQILAIHMKASFPGKLNMTVLLTRDHFSDSSGKKDSDTVWLSGNLGKNGIDYILAVKACTLGGTVKAVGETLLIENAQEAVIYLAEETSFYRGDSYIETAFMRLETAAEEGYEKIKQKHLVDYRSLFDRVSFEVSGEMERDLLEETQRYFQYGRYLLISSSRPGSQAATLQGIWNDQMQPAWDSKYTININTEMNYWPAEICNLSECHLPLFDLLKRMQPRGREVAEKMYGCRGMTAHHNTDIWGDCAPQDICISSTYWVLGAAWLCMHIMWHYRYTRDKNFLKDCFPILEDTVLFFHDFLMKKDGYVVTCPTVSPENTYILSDGINGRVCAGATMDNEILRDLFSDYLEARIELKMDMEEEKTTRTRELLSLLQPLQIGKHGQIMEWPKDYEEVEPGHRHISHLYALHPSYQITIDETPELAEAARKTLERRLFFGGGHTGWSCAWIVNFYSRLGDGEKAWENLKKLWEKSTFPNRMDNHPMGQGAVFQIDGNLGATAAIAEMLVQSTEKRTLLLPALPRVWENGYVRGLKLSGGISLDMRWEKGVLVDLELYNEIMDQKIFLLYGNKSCTCVLKKGERRKLDIRDF